MRSYALRCAKLAAEFAGEHLSYVGLWQEGSALSAHEALKLVAAMAKAKAAN